MAMSITITRGCSSLRQLDGLLPLVASPTTRISGIVFQHAPKALSHQAVIVHQQNGNFTHTDILPEISGAAFPTSHSPVPAGASGTSRRTSVPPSGGLRNSMLPRSNSARSRMATIPMPRRMPPRLSSGRPTP